jgi:DNA-binding NarL/FixJ family response regulator
MRRARIILADDHVMIIDAIKVLLDSEFDVVGTFQDGLSLIESAAKLTPDVIVLDIGMPIMNGLIAGERLRAILPRVKLIYVTMSLDRDVAAEALRIGASGYLLKTSAGSELPLAIREVMLGRRYVTPLLLNRDEVSITALTNKKKPRKLTFRQKEVLQLLAEGHSMKQVAHILNLSPRTIAFHKYTIMEHLQLKSSAELIQYALQNSIVRTS